MSDMLYLLWIEVCLGWKNHRIPIDSVAN